MSTLVVLIAIVATDVVELTFRIDMYLIDITYSYTFALKAGLIGWAVDILAMVGKTIFTQFLLFGLLLFRLFHKGHYDTIAGDKVFVRS